MTALIPSGGLFVINVHLLSWGVCICKVFIYSCELCVGLTLGVVVC